MIIASPAKKETPIPLETISTSDIFDKQDQKQESVEEYVLRPRTRGQHDMITQVFGQASACDTKVNDILSIHTTHSLEPPRTLTCEAFILNETVFLNSPFSGAGLLHWANGEFQSCITHLIELAEEKTGCTTMVVSLDRRLYKESLSTLLRAFMYMGFEMVNPTIFRQEPGYILVGYEF